MARTPRKWRTAKRKGAGGTYWSLRAGRGDNRVAISLAYVSSRKADLACAQMNEEESRGNGGVILQWHKEARDDAVRYLIGDPDARDRFVVRPDYGAMALRDYFDDVYRDWRAAENPASWSQDEGRWRRILEVLGDLRLRQVDAHVVADYLDELRVLRGPRKGKLASGNTRKLHRAAIAALLKRALRLKHIEVAPDLGSFPIKGANKLVAEKSDPLSLRELHDLMESSAPKFRAMWAVATGQGLRPTELNPMRWEDIDFEHRTLQVRGEKNEEAYARVPLTPLAYRELRRWWEHCSRPARGLVFPSRGGRPYTEQGWSKALKQAAKRAGIERRAYPRLLRDSFATISWLLGIPLGVARQVMRHTQDSKVLEEVYCRPRPEDIVPMLEAFDLVDLDDSGTKGSSPPDG